MKKHRFAETLSLLALLASCGGKPSSSPTPGSSRPSSSSSPSPTIIDPGTETDHFLVKDGASDYQIVLPSPYSRNEENAAAELASFFLRSAGAAIAITTDEEVSWDLQSSFICLGDVSFLEKAGVSCDKSALNGDGFYFISKGNTLFILADNANGILYGVYQFAEEYFGIRFLSYDATYLPRVNEVKFRSYNRNYVPVFRHRNYLTASVWGTSAENIDYCAHMRYATQYCAMPDYKGEDLGWCQQYVASDHNSLQYVNPDAVDGAGKPLYKDPATGLIKEEYRHIWAHNSSNDTAYCVDNLLSYPSGSTPPANSQVYEICWSDGIKEDGSVDETMEASAIKIAIQSMKEVIAKTDSTYYMFGQQDRYFAEPSPETQEAAGKYTMTGVMIRFMNALDDAIQSWAKESGLGREIRLVMFAYQYDLEAPVKEEQGKYVPLDPTVKPNEDLYFLVCPIAANSKLPLSDPQQTVMEGLFEKWGSLTRHIFSWTYPTYFPEYFFYYNCIGTTAEDLRYLSENGVVYPMLQGTFTEKISLQQYIHSYVASHLFWDLNADVDALRREFVNLYFGEAAAPLMQEVIDRFDDHDAMLASSYGPSYYHYGAFTKAEYWPIGFLLDQVELFEKAEKAILASPYSESEKASFAERVGKFKLVPEWMVLRNYDDYYPNDDYGRAACGENFVAEFSSYGGTYYGEGASRSIASFVANGYRIAS